MSSGKFSPTYILARFNGQHVKASECNDVSVSLFQAFPSPNGPLADSISSATIKKAKQVYVHVYMLFCVEARGMTSH